MYEYIKTKQIILDNAYMKNLICVSGLYNILYVYNIGSLNNKQDKKEVNKHNMRNRII